MLHFDHAQIALGLVVVKRHGKIVQKPQYPPLSVREAIQQIAGWALFGSPCGGLCLGGRRRCWWRRIGLIPFGQDFLIAVKQACQDQDIQFVLTQSRLLGKSIT